MSLAMIKNFSGGIGNQLFQLNFLHQAAKQLDTSLFHRQSQAGRMVHLSQRPKISNALRSLTSVSFSKSEIEMAGYRAWLSRACELLTMGRSITIEPGVLGSIFFDSCMESPRNIIPLRAMAFDSVQDVASNTIQIAIHFRGGDFASWNPSAILQRDYYMDALDYLDSAGIDMSNIYFSTDDTQHETSQFILRRLGKEPNLTSKTSEDFFMLSKSNYLISSPSTFSFWAAVLGENVKVIHSKRWLDQCEEKESKFWIDVRKNRKPFYNLVQEI